MFNMFKAPYLDTDDGINLSGGTSAEGQQTVDQQTGTTQDDGKQQAQQSGQQTQTEVPKIKVKFNHEEKELDLDEAIPFVQKGMNYDRIYPEYEKLRNHPAISFVSSQAAKYGMTVEQYLEAVKKAEEQQALNELIQKNIPEEYAREMLENRKFRERLEAKEKEIQEKEARERDYMDFTEWYTKTYGKEPNPDEIPMEVWQAVEKGTPLKYAFMEHGYSTMNDRLSKLEQQFQTQQANQKNAESSTGSVKSSGKPATFFTREQVEAMTVDEVYRNYDAIMESKKHWK